MGLRKDETHQQLGLHGLCCTSPVAHRGQYQELSTEQLLQSEKLVIAAFSAQFLHWSHHMTLSHFP